MGLNKINAPLLLIVVHYAKVAQLFCLLAHAAWLLSLLRALRGYLTLSKGHLGLCHHLIYEHLVELRCEGRFRFAFHLWSLNTVVTSEK